MDIGSGTVHQADQEFNVLHFRCDSLVRPLFWNSTTGWIVWFVLVITNKALLWFVLYHLHPKVSLESFEVYCDLSASR